MKISLEWLKEFVPIRPPMEKLCERLSMGGLEVVGIDKRGEDTILEIEITPNRPDLLSHIGIAREIAALTGARMKFPKRQATSDKRQRSRMSPLRISIQDKKGCLRYIGRLFDGVQVGATPSWMRGRLERLGLRSVNNVVDSTNYVLLETGQPLHAFDYDKIEGGEIIIRSAHRGEILLTIDGENRTLQEGDLVIADSKKPIALAGVVGGKDTEIGSNTTRVLLESAYFDPVRVRRTSRRLGLSTDSSYRFERGVSLEGVQTGSERAHSLFEKYAGARWVAPAIDQGKKSFPKRTLSVSLEELGGILGVSPTMPQTRSILSSLGCRINTTKKTVRIIPPPFRQDLKETVDVAEEVGRILGYDRIPMTVPLRERVSVEKESLLTGTLRGAENRMREILVSQGLFEVVTYSLLSRSLLNVFLGEKSDAISIQNPISLEQEMMRPSLIPRLAEAASYNHHRKAEGVPIFEIGPVYEREGKGYRERKKLALLLSGHLSGNWKDKPRPYGYFDLKGRCESIIGALNSSLNISYHRASLPFFSQSSKLVVAGDKEIGVLGELSSPAAHFLDLKGKVFAAELDVLELVSLAVPTKRYDSLPKHPSIRRDISLIIDQKVSSEEIIRTIQKEGGGWVRAISLFDMYSDLRIVPEGSRGLAYHIEFLHPDRTLTDDEVNEEYQRILSALRSRGAQIR